MPGAGMDGINCIGLFILDEAGRVKPFLNCGGKDLWAASKVKSSPHTPCLPRFILLGSFSDTLLVVSILDIIAICSRFCSPEGVN